MNASSIETALLTLPDQQQYDGDFPLVIANRDPGIDLSSAVRWVQANREQFDAQSRRHGAILFRDFPLQTAEDFDAWVVAFGYENFAYEESLSNAVRVNKTPRVFTANEAPPNVTIFLHHEMAQTPIYPSRLFFFCEQAASEGGATPLCRSDVLWNRLEQECPQFAKDCEQKGLRYSSVMPGFDDPASGMGRSWQSTFRATTREEAESRLRRLQYDWQWLDNDCLRATTPLLPAVRTLPDGRKVFFNQLIAAFQGWKDERNDPAKAITHGDGSPLESSGVQTAARLGEELSFDIPWQNGDVALVDNYVVMHGRRTFSGTRRILASLVARESLAEGD